MKKFLGFVLKQVRRRLSSMIRKRESTRKATSGMAGGRGVQGQEGSQEGWQGPRRDYP